MRDVFEAGLSYALRPCFRAKIKKKIKLIKKKGGLSLAKPSTPFDMLEHCILGWLL